VSFVNNPELEQLVEHADQDDAGDELEHAEAFAASARK